MEKDLGAVARVTRRTQTPATDEEAFAQGYPLPLLPQRAMMIGMERVYAVLGSLDDANARPALVKRLLEAYPESTLPEEWKDDPAPQFTRWSAFDVNDPLHRAVVPQLFPETAPYFYPRLMGDPYAAPLPFLEV